MANKSKNFSTTTKKRKMAKQTKTPRKGKKNGKKSSGTARALIKEEAREAEAFKLATVKGPDGKPLVRLTRRNVAKVEAMIATDSAYRREADRTVGPKGKYKGSEAYCVSRFVEALDGRKNIDDKEFRARVKAAVTAVDRTNSTHLNADRVGVNQISKRIAEFRRESDRESNREAIKTCLKNADLALFDEIVKRTKKGLKRRANVSFASKFCRAACFYLFEGKAEADNFPAYDTVVRENLPAYMEFYGVEPGTPKKKLGEYRVFKRVIDEIRDAAAKKNSGEMISRRGFDHLLWYYHKGQ